MFPHRQSSNSGLHRNPLTLDLADVVLPFVAGPSAPEGRRFAPAGGGRKVFGRGDGQLNTRKRPDVLEALSGREIAIFDAWSWLCVIAAITFMPQHLQPRACLDRPRTVARNSAARLDRQNPGQELRFAGGRGQPGVAEYLSNSGPASSNLDKVCFQPESASAAHLHGKFPAPLPERFSKSNQQRHGLSAAAVLSRLQKLRRPCQPRRAGELSGLARPAGGWPNALAGPGVQMNPRDRAYRPPQRTQAGLSESQSGRRAGRCNPLSMKSSFDGGRSSRSV